MTPRRRGLAVLVKGWPRLSETFIAQELVALEQAGLDFDLWSLRHPTDTKTHPLHDALTARVYYLPEYLRDEPGRVLAGLIRSLLRPGFWAALAVFAKDLNRDRTRNRLRRFGQACVLAREAAPDVVAYYAHFLHTPSSVARYAAIIGGKRWSFSAHAKDIWTSPDWELSEKLALSSYGADFGATCTALNASHLGQMARGTDVSLVYHGLDLGRFPPPPDREIRSPGAPIRFLSVGRLVEKKGFDRLLAAFALLPKTLDWHWTHIGGGALNTVLQSQAEGLGITDRITWRGACDQPEVIQAMRDNDLFVLPSRIAEDGDRDGLPNVLMEAASQKMPILSTPVSAIPEFVTHGTHGWLSQDDPESLATALQAFADDPDMGHRMADAAFVRLTADFTMQPGIAVLAKRLSQLLDDSGAA